MAQERGKCDKHGLQLHTKHSLLFFPSLHDLILPLHVMLACWDELRILEVTEDAKFHFPERIPLLCRGLGTLTLVVFSVHPELSPSVLCV